jgi:hypothetical protein
MALAAQVRAALGARAGSFIQVCSLIELSLIL